MLSKSKSHYIPILLFLVSGLLGVSSYSTELSTKTEVNRSLSRDRKTISNIASERLLNSEKLSNNQVDEIDIYPIKNPNLLKISGPDVTLVFKKTEAKKIFEYLADIANYGFVYVKNNATNDSDSVERLISLTLENVSYQKAFNSVLLASGLQAKLHNNVLYIGPNVRDRVFSERSSGVYQLNQISASSAADYLANLGASVTKTYTITTSVTQGASQSQAVEGASSSSTTTDQSETSVKVYGASIGPLVGLIATTDERLRTVTMFGEKNIIDLAKVFLQRLDKKQKQVALNVRVLDINLSDKDRFTQSWGMAFEQGSPFIIGSGGMITSSIGQYIPKFSEAEKTPGNSYKKDSFFGLLQTSIETGSTKVLASPTLLLSESSGEAGDGSIGMKNANEGFVQVGDNVPINATPGEGGCTFSYGLVGVELGAKVLGIDQNKYITFTMSPVVTGISGSVNVVGCGEVQILNERKVNTGAVRIKDGETLVLTGVIQNSDIKKLYKYPILGDLPILGALFRSKDNQNNKRELIVLVTPKIINDGITSIQDYNLEYSDTESKKLLESMKFKK